MPVAHPGTGMPFSPLSLPAPSSNPQTFRSAPLSEKPSRCPSPFFLTLRSFPHWDCPPPWVLGSLESESKLRSPPPSRCSCSPPAPWVQNPYERLSPDSLCSQRCGQPLSLPPSLLSPPHPSVPSTILLLVPHTQPCAPLPSHGCRLPSWSAAQT